MHDSRPLWGSRVQAPLTEVAAELSSSVAVDRPLASHDVAASRAHLAELVGAGIIDEGGARRLDGALADVLDSIMNGTFAWDDALEDVHMHVEQAVRAAVGPDLAGHLQAGRSRNEEIVTDERLWLLDAAGRIDAGLLGCLRTLARRAGEELDTILPAHTHTQPAQPMLLAHHLLAHAEALARDRERFAQAAARLNRSPAGSGASVGSGLPIDRERVARRLGFGGITANSLDAVADRDYAVEMAATAAMALMHLSRVAADLVWWSTPYLRFARIADGWATGSSMLPNKRNPDIAELVRARASRVSGNLATMLGIVNGLPLGYHRDLQETRRPMLDAIESLELSLAAVDGMLRTVTFDRDAMRRAAGAGHALATAVAERLVRSGVPFRDAHWRVGSLVARAEELNCDLYELPPDELRAALPELADLPNPIPTLEEAVAAADVGGGTHPARVRASLQDLEERLS
ncbi:MAG: argininosuccinate lyase [Chloroflexi bacterium]|nr:argininosuccinate lyase [Chloroflexota bacterium]